MNHSRSLLACPYVDTKNKIIVPNTRGPTFVVTEPQTVASNILTAHNQLFSYQNQQSPSLFSLYMKQTKQLVQDQRLSKLLNDQHCLYPVRLSRLLDTFKLNGEFYPYQPQSGNDKMRRRDDFAKKNKGKIKDKRKVIEKTKGKQWSPEVKKLQQEFVRSPHKYQPHGGMEDALKHLQEQSKLIGKQLPPQIWSKIEGLVLLATSLYECQSETQAVSIILLYLKTHYTESICSMAYNLFKEIIDESIGDENTNDETVPHTGTEKPNWLTLLREGMTNWRLITNNPVFKKISYLISICITLGICEASSFTWEVQGVRLFCISAMEKHFSALDMIDAAIETVVYFVEAGYACFTSKSLTPLLFSDQEAREFEEDFGFLVANLEHVKTGNLQKMVGIDDNMYDARLTQAITKATQFHATARGTWEKKIFFDRLAQLRKIRTTFDSIRVQGGLRIAPYTMNIFGKSGVGKSSVGTISMVMALISNGFCADDEFMATLNESDKYMSNYRSFINGIFLDDVGNTKPDFVEKSPTNKIIEICNNVRQYANMAEADLKGKVSIEPRVVVITTNVKSLCSHTYSNEPVSIARRAHLTVTVRVRPQFCSSGLQGAVGQQLDSAKVARYYTNADGVVDIPIVPDLWELTVERVVPVASDIEEEPDQIEYEVLEYQGYPLVDVDIHTFIKFMIDHSRKYFAQQKILVEQSNNMASKIKMCKCGTPADYCDCPDLIPEETSVSDDEEETPAVFISEEEWENNERQLDEENKQIEDLQDVTPHGGLVGYATGVALGQFTQRFYKFCSGIWDREGSIIERETTTRLCKLADRIERDFWYSWTNLIPNSWLKTKYAKRFINYAMRDHILTKVKREALCTLTLAGMLFYVAPYSTIWPIPVLGGLYVMFRGAVIVSTVKERVHMEIVQRNDAMSPVFKRVRDNQGKYVLAALGVIGTLYTLLKIWQGFRNALKGAHGNLSPTCAEDVMERDSEQNPWAKYTIAPIPVSNVHETSSPDIVKNLIFKNQVFLRVKQDDSNRISGGIFLKSSVLLMPYHIWFRNAKTSGTIEEDLEVSITRSSDEMCGVFKAYFSLQHMERIPNTDFCLVWVPNSGSYRDITKFLPLETIKGGPCSMVYRDGDGNRIDANANIVPGKVGHCESQFEGATYRLSIPTFNGLCMGTFVTHYKATYIAGFHLGGRTGTPEGVLGTLNQTQVQDALNALDQKTITAHSEGTMQTNIYGINILEKGDVHYKCPTRFMEPGCNMLVHGPVKGVVTPHSNVVTSGISKIVEEVCGVPQKWGPPRLRPAWKPWQTTLQSAARPSIGVEGSYLEWAVRDYEKPLIDLVLRHDWIKKDIRPLNKMETVCGRDGIRFIDKMPPNTSVGYPLNAPKSDYLVLLDPDDHPDHQYPTELDPMFWTEYERMYECWKKGERAYPIFKGCLKDEPTKLTKDKVRVFQAAPIALQLAIRKFFLPIARFLSMNPLLSECACGINSQGPEWNVLQQFITKFGKDRIFAGDYSAYDTRMPAQLTFSGFRVLIDIARISGNYTEEELFVMKGIATDVCYPVMAYNGTLIQLIGTNPSGQNLTVYTNSIVNSLLNRCGFYHYMKDKWFLGHKIKQGSVTFRDAVALMTYGDDVKGSVKKGFDDFNHISYADFLAKRDMKFTMPDKESTPTKYMNDDDADFLKRKNIWNEEVQMYFGALDENSIFKSLHCVVKSNSLSMQEQCVANIDGALREWFAYGEEVYEKRRSEMRAVAERAGLVCHETEVPYSERMTAWKDKYIPNEG